MLTSFTIFKYIFWKKCKFFNLTLTEISLSKCYFVIPGGAMNAMYCYSPLSDTWTLVSRLGERASCAIAACNNKLFITGGRDNKNQVISTVMCWDVTQGVLTEECVLPMGVSHHGSVTLMKSYTQIHKITRPAESQWQTLSTGTNGAKWGLKIKWDICMYWFFPV